MKIITEPKVYLVSENRLMNEGLQQFLRDEGVSEKWQPDTLNDPQTVVEVAGRVCYMSFAKPRPGGNHAYIKHILEVGHGSVLEHAVFSLLITGVSRSLTHELVRHRVGMSPSQLSQRYVDESDCDFVLPPGIKIGSDEYDCWLDATASANESYQAISHDLFLEMADIPDPTLRRKRAREAARSVLPNCTATKIFVTGNARAWRHFLEMRGSEHADAEISRLARAVLAKLQGAAPNLFGDYVVTNNVISTPYRKV